MEPGDEVTPTHSKLTAPTIPRQRYQRYREKEPQEGEAEENDDEDSSSDYLSFDSDKSEDEDTRPEMKAAREARAYEQQLALEAAGLVLTQTEDQLPSAPVRYRSIKCKCKPPPNSFRRTPVPLVSITKPLPPVPQVEVWDTEPDSEQELEGEPEISHSNRILDDAFARYELFKQQTNRLSVASTDVPSSASSGSQTRPQSEHVEGSGIKTWVHWLGRSRTPEDSSKKGVSISAPFPRPPNSSGSLSVDGEVSPRAASPAFGTSWASLVDPAALAGIPCSERRRQEAIFELINTEAAYVRDLQLIVEVFYSALLPLLSPKEVVLIFANIEDILLTNTAFLSALEERQKECRLYMNKIGDILLSHIPNMALYMEYCVNQAKAIKVLKSLRDKNGQLETHLQRLKDGPAVRNLDLSSYLLAPMQRITRYPLLIQQVLNYTESQEEKHDIEKAVETSKRLLDHINESIRDQEGRAKLKTLSRYLWIGQGRLDLTAPTKYMGSRKLLREGTLLKARSGRKLHGFLCTDIFVLTHESQKSLYCMPIPLAHVRVINGKDDLTFEVFWADSRGREPVVLKALSTRERQTWMQEIDYARRRCRHAEERAVKAVMTKKRNVRRS